MPQVMISGVHINFPFEPYDVQKTYMEKVLQSLQTAKNAVLESPTGTGKTLCLLCSSLAWLETFQAQQQAQMLRIEKAERDHISGEYQAQLMNHLIAGTGISWGDVNCFGATKIIYSSRTHSQLSQAVQELKRSDYKGVKATVVGSRDQLCIHPEVLKETNTASKIQLCRAKVSARTCHYYNGVEAALANSRCRESPIADIEDLVKIGKTNNCCPYYLSKTLKQDASIIFMPYNYLLDSKARKAHGIDLNGNVIIFDEAHNVEKMCEESVSVELSSKDVAFCISEVTHVMEEMAYIESSKGQSFDMTNINRGADTTFTLHDVVILKTLFCELEAELDKIPLGQGNCATFPGQYIFEFLAKVELTVEKKDIILELLDRIIQYLSSGSLNPMARRFAGLQKFAEMIKVIFTLDKYNKLCFNKSAASYKVHVSIQDQKFGGHNDVWTSATRSFKQPRLLSYWCFNPGVGMQNLLEETPRCILLTSGTLAPLDTFTHELQVPLPIQLENPHIIKKNQVWVGVVSHGPDGTLLNSSYQNRTNSKYINALGSTIVNFSRVVPEGLLVFFPSYSVMYECQKSWEGSHIWNSIGKHKAIFQESKIRRDFQETMSDFYRENGEKGKGGGIFLAVCRGKVSEGLDFADHNGRAVIVTGLPYPPWKDPKVTLKMEYLNEQIKQNGKGTGGQSWYSLEASRAVNQAIGRVIRHKDDYGAIILCDSRFGEKRFQMQLSSWLRPHIQSLPNFGASIKSVTQFFKDIRPQAHPVVNEVVQSTQSSSRSIANEFSSPAKLPTKGTWEWLNMHMEEVRQCNEQIAKNEAARGPSDFFGALDKHAKLQSKKAAKTKQNLAQENQTSEASSYKDLTPVAAKKRKFNVLGPKQAFEKKQQEAKTLESLSDLGPSSSTSQVPGPSGSNTDQNGNAQRKEMVNFLLDVRKYLTPEEYDKFKMAIKRYSKERDLEILVVDFSPFTSNPEIFKRIKAFRNFVFKHHREQYDDYMIDFELKIESEVGTNETSKI